ncbi:hypothetical protein LDENG_00205170, partial [Lucifuga dentata]
MLPKALKGSSRPRSRSWRTTVRRSDCGCSPRILCSSSGFWALWSFVRLSADQRPSASWTPRTARLSPRLA